MTDHHPSRQAFQQFQYLTVPLVGADHTNRALRAVLDRAFGEQGDR
jgi:hypothetical protein